MTTDLPQGVQMLAEHECWQALRAAEVGRLAVTFGGRPDVFPVNFVVDHGTVVIRTAPGRKVDAALESPGVAFECDGFDAVAGQAWSVVLKGRAELLRSTQELAQTVGLPLFPWHSSPKPRFLRIVPDEISGRRFVTVDPGYWSVAGPTRSDARPEPRGQA